MEKVDTHLHLLYPENFKYSWTEGFPALQKAFTIEDFQELAQPCSIQKAVFMEVDVDAGHEVNEARFFIEKALQPESPIAGAIAKLEPAQSDFQEQLETILTDKLKGIRRVLHVAPDELSTTPIFRENVASLAKYDLSFDICVRQDQLHLACELVHACPNTRFIIDHCGNPDLNAHLSGDKDSRTQWKHGLANLAGCENTICKFSALGTFVEPSQRNAESLRSHFDELLETFGPHRLVWGSDWPVCNLGAGVIDWSSLSEELTSQLSFDEQTMIFTKNAHTVYSL
ncbi:MAG: amidohydrolase family protein [Opitutales bacterium]